MAFDELVQVRTTKKNTKLGERGCDACPLSKVKGIHKIMGELAGKDILVIGQSPGFEENDAQEAFVGKSGKFLWQELRAVDIRRGDCDGFNVVRCFPSDLQESSYRSFLKMRNPTAKEIHCCSVHTESEMGQSKAKHILVLGQVAQKAFLATRSVPAQKIFWSEKHQAKIYLADHPSYFASGYGTGARLESFKGLLKQLAADWKNEDVEATDNFAYLRRMDYRLVSTKKQAQNAERIIRAYAAKRRRISVDIESDEEVGGTFTIGFSPKSGLSFIFVYNYSSIEQSAEDENYVRNVAIGLLQDGKVKKALQFGCSDVLSLRKDGIEVKGFDWDTYISEYLWYPDAKAYGLEAIAERRYPQFSGYKHIILQDLLDGLPEDVKVPTAVKNAGAAAQLKWLSKNGHYHLSRLKPETLRLYNGADADLTKRLEIDGKKYVDSAGRGLQPLVRMYIDLSFVLKMMELHGPYFDTWQADQLMRLYPYLANKQAAVLRKMTKNPEFNPGSPQQVYDFIYKKLKLAYPLRKGKPNTQKKTMLMLGREHPFPPAVVEWRKRSKANSTIEGYKEVALKFGGRLVTKWKMDGTATGRLSSSGGDDGGTNLQNVSKDPHMQNMLVADKRWRIVFNAITDILKHQPEGDWEECVEGWVRKHMPDLKTFLILDYGQIEIRLMAILSGDKNLIADCASDDIHAAVGSAMTSWDPQKIKDDNKTRTLTKNIHFGMIYLIAKHNLYDFIKAMDPTSDVTEKFVSDAYDRYFARYTGVRAYMDKQQEFAQEHGYVETVFGLHRTLNVGDVEKPNNFGADGDDEMDVVSMQEGKQVSWRSQSVNTPVQGTAHQLLECGLVNHERQPEKYAVLNVPCMDVHDALYYRVNVLEIHEAYRKARYLMEHESLKTAKKDFPHIKWTVPIVVEAEAGLRLGAKIKLKDDQFTVGGFLLLWYEKTKKQISDLRKQLEQVPEAA
jgi:uracil-DNA glycosylase family 4